MQLQNCFDPIVNSHRSFAPHKCTHLILYNKHLLKVYKLELKSSMKSHYYIFFQIGVNCN